MGGVKRAPSSLVQHTSSSGRLVAHAPLVERAQDLEAGQHADDAVVLAARDLRVEVAAHQHRRQMVVACRAGGRRCCRPGRPSTVQPASVHQVTKRSRISLSASVRARRRRPPALPGPISPERMTVLQKRRGSIAIDASWVLMGPIMPRSDASSWARGLGDNTVVSYVDPSTGRTYPLTEARWRADNGHYLNLAPAPGLRRADIDRLPPLGVALREGAARRTAAHAVSLGEGWHAARSRRLGRRASALQARVHDADRLVQGPRHDRDGELSQEPRHRPRARGLVGQRRRVARPPTRPRRACTCRILVPETASYPKIAQIAACGADVVTIKGSRQDVAEAALRQSAEIFYASHNWQPFFVEGTKTLAYELWEQLGFARARQRRGPARLRQQRARRRPRLRRAARATARSPSGRGSSACRRRAARPTPPRSRRESSASCRRTIAPTIAEGIATAKPTRVAEVLRAVRGQRRRPSSRWRKRRSWRRCAISPAAGLYVEPTSAVAAAGLTRLLPSGAIRPHERTVLVLTGSGLKASATIGELLKLAPRTG